jgi:fumarylacetoacetate (FAA) hydrolase
MKLATLKSGGRDGVLVVVSRDLVTCQRVPKIAATLQFALDNWDAVAPRLRNVYADLNEGTALAAEPFVESLCHSPLPRAYQWADGSAYINHVELVRKARNAVVPASFYTDPLMYQGGSDSFVGPWDPICALDEAWGIDLEAEVAVITGDVEMGADLEKCAQAIKLVMLVNDVSLRNLIPGELAKGFGFFQSKPASAFSPVAVTPDDLPGWKDGKLAGALSVELNGKPLGEADAAVDMTFDFGTLIAHAARTRSLSAGSIVGSGTVSNRGPDGGPGKPVAEGGVGYSCLAEIRTIETIASGKPKTPFLAAGDTVRIEMRDAKRHSIFGAIEQVVAAA